MISEPPSHRSGPELSVRIDRGLPVGPRPPEPGPIGAAQPEVARAGPAGGRPFLVEGERVAAIGDERRGVASVLIDGVRVAGNLVSDAGVAANVLIGPGLMRRELVGSGGTALEATFALPSLPMLAVEWAPQRGAGRAWTGALTLLPDEKDVRYRIEGSTAVAAGERGEVRVVLHPEPDEWRAMEGAGGGVAIQATVGPTARVTLLVVAGDEHSAARTLKATPHLSAHAVRAAGDADRGGDGGLRLITGVGTIDHAVAWATVRLRGALRRAAWEAPGDGDDAAGRFWTALGAVASGDDEACHAAWAAWSHAEGTTPVELVPGGSAHAGALSALLAGRLTLVTGDAAPALAAAARLGPRSLEIARRRSDDVQWGVWTMALRALADALQNAVPPPRVQELREVASVPAGRRTAMRLPMLGSPVESDRGAGTLLARLLAGGVREAFSPAEVGAGRLEQALGAWERLSGGETDAGWTLWRTALASGLDGATGRGLWDPPALRGGGGAPVTGALLAALGYGLLRIAPDAPAGRLGLAPSLPSHLSTFRAEGIRVGDARVTLDFHRQDRTRRFELTPTGGRTPPMVVLEPTVPGRPEEIRIDGTPAALDRIPVPGGTRVRVQLPLDGPRVLEIDDAIDGEDERGAGRR